MNNTDPIKLNQSYNLTRSLGFNAYQLFYADSVAGMKATADFLNDKYSTAALENILKDAAELIGAKVLNVSSADYEPLGSSVALLLADAETPVSPAATVAGNIVLGHLDKSHLTVHTYPQIHAESGICSLRIDLDLATCGTISPLATMPLLFERIQCDAAIVDYRIRGYQVLETGELDFGCSDMVSIADSIPTELKDRYYSRAVNAPDVHVYHTRLMKRQLLASEHALATLSIPGADELNKLEEHLALLYKG